jgi:hypothetical protein
MPSSKPALLDAAMKRAATRRAKGKAVNFDAALPSATRCSVGRQEVEWTACELFWR